MRNSKYIVDPNGEHKGCFHECLAYIIGIALAFALCLCFGGCKSQQPIVTETNTNTLIEREQVDSLINSLQRIKGVQKAYRTNK